MSRLKGTYQATLSIDFDIDCGDKFEEVKNKIVSDLTYAIKEAIKEDIIDETQGTVTVVETKSNYIKLD